MGKWGLEVSLTQHMHSGHFGLQNALNSIMVLEDGTRRWIRFWAIAITTSKGVNVPDCSRSYWNMVGLSGTGLRGTGRGDRVEEDFC